MRRIASLLRRIARRCRHGSSDRGSALVEFGIAATVLGALMFGIMEFSVALYVDHFLSNAAREATRYASVRGSTLSASCSTAPMACRATASDVLTYVQSIMPSGFFASSTTTTCSTPPSSTAGVLAVCTTWPGTTEGSSTNSCQSSGSSGTIPVNSPGCVVEVQVQYTYKMVLPFLNKNLGLSSTSTMVISN
jgi:Flp pilus assembly protein TadG